MSTDPAKLIAAIRDNARGLHVLYVEDDPLIGREYLTFLSRFFENIRHESNGEKGLEAALETPFDLVITDIEMPKFDGLTMIEKIKERYPDLSTLLVSAHKDVNYLHRSIQLGVDGYLFKPMEREQTMATLHKVVGKIKMERENVQYRQHLEELVETKTREAIQTYTFDRISGLYSLGKLEQDIFTYSNHTLVLFKIGDFKHLNDTYGYDAGNAVLQQTASILRRLVNDEMNVEHHGLYRTSGTHFALLSPAGVQSLEPLVHLIVQHFEATEIVVAGEKMYLEMYAAIVHPGDELSLSHADFALRQAEKEGRTVIYRSAEHHNHGNSYKLKCIDTIKRAIVENRFVPFYQPIIDNTTMRIVKYEALLRLMTPDGQFLSPVQFLPIAKETKMYRTITKLVIASVLNDFRDSECSVSINLSIEDISHHPTREFLFQQIASFPEPHRLVFELLESEGVESYAEIQNFFAKLKELGCKVALDDFGSGYSNFEHLAKLNVDYIKFDGSLIETIATDYVSQSIVELLTTFAERLGIRTIAEYVSAEALHERICSLGVCESQGYLFGAPMPFDPCMKKIRPVEPKLPVQEAIISAAV
ncbi:MAG: EAL domain-containing protein [Campylobacterota bacterium]